MDTPFHDIADPFTEAGFRALARRGLDAAPSEAIFDPRSGQALGPERLGPEPRAQGRPRRHAAAAAGRGAGADRAAPGAHRAPHPALARVAEPRRPDLLSRRQGGRRRREPARLRPARGAGGDRAARRPTSSRSAISTAIAPAPASRSCRWWRLVRPGFTLALDPREVAEAFEVPLRFLMDPANHRKGFARMARAGGASSMRCPTRSAIFGAPPPAC